MKRLISMLMALSLCMCMTTCAFEAEEPEPDYLAMMVTAASRGDLEAGREAERQRNALIDESGSAELKISFDELYLLSKFIYSEAGSDWLTGELRMCVGEVVLNRVASPEYPNSLEGVIFQEGQYEGVSTEEFKNHTIPSRDCVKAALRLLQGERMMEPQVVFQASYRMGVVYATYCDRMRGYTYFCESPNLELYQSGSEPLTEELSETGETEEGKISKVFL